MSKSEMRRIAHADPIKLAEAVVRLQKENADLKELLKPDNLREIIAEWKHFWMNQKQNSEADYKNYFNRAFGIDANMSWNLADRIASKAREAIGSENE